MILLPAPEAAPARPSGQGPALLESRREADRLLLRPLGAWTLDALRRAEDDLRRALIPPPAAVILDLSGLARLDTAGALVLNASLDALRRQGVEVETTGTDAAVASLLDFAAPLPPEQPPPAPSLPYSLITALGRNVCAASDTALRLTEFFGRFLACLSAMLLHPRRLRLTSLVFHMEQTGLKAVPIVALLTFLVGMVVAYMGAKQLQQYGAQVFAVNLLEVSIMREMGVLITAIVVAGRSSSSFTAQIGAMVANEEVDALRSMGLDPMSLLVAPRILALILTLPLLVFTADMAALCGGAAALHFSLDISFPAFLTQLQAVARPQNFLVGLAKAPFFAILIGCVGCFQGFRATGSAESVGFLTTVAVVQALFLVILADALFAILFTAIGI
ncbi:MAG: MlaE family lipid ABC transporter permease subunit [Desulfovibrio sp.]|nr:MlaE family lipid ABC transporter permease subunit [Desulfovibrio sp.]